MNIGEDMRYEAGPATVQAYAGAKILANISASPFHVGKALYREKMFAARATDSVIVVVHINLIGGQEELVFDDNSLISSQKGISLLKGNSSGKILW